MVTSMQSSVDSDAVSYPGRGIHGVNEVARLLRSGRARVEGWARPRKDKPPLLTGELAGLFSFWDLLSLRVFAELTRRGVHRDHIARNTEHLARATYSK
ncbi:MAG: hypothetical protein OXI96_00490 [Acidimicrobiaceae bacterium]|nr:hypothetical protein [Acidimicrobiaceae bacterium]